MSKVYGKRVDQGKSQNANVTPLIHFTSDRLKMGTFVNRRWVIIVSRIVALAIILLNGKPVLDFMHDWWASAAWWHLLIILPVLGAVFLLLGCLLAFPRLRPAAAWDTGPATAIQTVAREIRPMPLETISVALQYVLKRC
jgi:manganese transport protein